MRHEAFLIWSEVFLPETLRPPRHASHGAPLATCGLPTAPCYIHSVSEYTEDHAKSGIDAGLPSIECWPNQYPGYEISITMPEFTSICPKTGLPDFGLVTIRYQPDQLCLELKSLKEYFGAYRNLGIFYENAVNRILKDMVSACAPVKAEVVGEFNTRGGMRALIQAKYGESA